MKKVLLLVFTVALSVQSSFAIDYYNTYPTHWWVGMKNTKLQLILHGEKIGQASTVAINYPGVKIEKINKVENKNYIFLDIIIAPNTKAGVFKIICQSLMHSVYTIIPTGLLFKTILQCKG